MPGHRLRAAYLAVAVIASGVFAGLPSDAGAAQSYFTSAGVGQLSPGVYGAAAALLPGDQVLVAGGVYQSAASDQAQTFNAITGSFTALSATLQTAREFPVAASLPNGDVLVAGGADGGTYLNTAELYDPTAGTFTTLSATMPYGFDAGVAVALGNGQVLIAGGSNASGALNQAMIFDPTSETFTQLPGGLTTARTGAFAAPLPNGEVLIGGGSNGVTELSSVELYNPASQTFTALSATTTVPRFGSVAAALPDGNVVVAGGESTLGDVKTANNSSELFSPSTNTFSALPAILPSLNVFGTATALTNGGVLVVGGENKFGTLNTGELFRAQPEAQISLNGFGPVNVGQSSAPQTLTITNLGYQSLAISGIASVFGGGFAITMNECVGVTLIYNQHCTMVVTFTPTGGGPQSATLTLADNELVPSSVTLSGTGVSPPRPAVVISTAARTSLALDLSRHRVSHRRATLAYTLNTAAAVTLSVTTRAGRRTVVERVNAGPGAHTLTWNGRLHGKRAKAGRYRLTVSAVADGVTVSHTTSIRL